MQKKGQHFADLRAPPGSIVKPEYQRVIKVYQPIYQLKFKKV